jgi:hypothetical protein
MPALEFETTSTSSVAIPNFSIVLVLDEELEKRSLLSV